MEGRSTTCLNCGKDFTTKQQHKYCSRSCYNDARCRKSIITCLNCGKDFAPKQQSKNYHPKYCSRSCYHDIRYGKMITSKTIESRNPLYIEAAKLLEEGFTQIEAAESTGINQYALYSWLHGHGAKNSAAILSNRVCRY